MGIGWIGALLAAWQLAACAWAPAAALARGDWLRLHVVAASDSAQDQQLKLRVRDAVQSAYAQSPAGGGMLERARRALPQLRQAAVEAARQAGYDGPVRVTLGRERLDTRTLGGAVIPAGDYPALMVRLGAAKGHNWWGLIDRETAMEAAWLPALGMQPLWTHGGVAWGLALPGWLSALLGGEAGA